MKAAYYKKFALRKHLLLLLFSLFVVTPGLIAQQNTYPKLKATEVDTLWGHNNSTPDSVVYNIFSKPNIVNTYGKEGNDPNLDWENMTPSEKASYFTNAIQDFIKLYPKYIKVIPGNDTILSVNDEACYFYTTLADYVIGGENNIENDPDPSNVLNKYPDIEQITIDNNGFGNLPILYITDISNANESHSVSGVFIQDSITQNITLEKDFQIRDSKTNVSALPGTGPMVKKGTVTICREGYFDGQFDKSTNLTFMSFQFDSAGNSYLTWINPKLITINPKIINLTTTSPNDTTIDYSSDWASKLKPFTTIVNQDTSAKIHTEDANGNITNITYKLQDSIYFSPDTTGLSTASDGTYVYYRINKEKFLQDGEQVNDILPNGRHFYTTLKESSATQKINVVKGASQADTAQNNEPTPDSVIYDPFNAQDLISGGENNDNFYKLDSAQKVQRFVQDIKTYIKLFPKYDVTGNNGNPVLIVSNHDTCDWYTTAANIFINGERNFKSDNTLIHFAGSDDIKDTLLKYNGHLNFPHKYVNTTESDGVAHSISGIFLFNSITQNTNLNDLCFVNSNTADLAGPGTLYMNPKRPISIDWVGYYGSGTYGHIKLITFLPKDPNTSKTSSEATASDWYLAWINPKLITINPKIINLTTTAPNDTTIDYSSDWASKLKPFTTTANQDTAAKIHTDDGTTTVDITYNLQDSIYFSPDTTGLTTTSDGTYTLNRIDKVKFVQAGEMKNTLGSHVYYTALKEKVSSQKVTIVKNTTGIEEHISGTSYGIVRVYPNPLNGSTIHIDYNARTPGLVAFSLYSLSGSRIRTFTRNLSQGINHVEISLQGIPGGNYVVGCVGQSEKVVVE